MYTLVLSIYRNLNIMQENTKRDHDKWELLLRVLTQELAEDASEFQDWLNSNDDNKLLYTSLKEYDSKDIQLFDIDGMYKRIAEALYFPADDKKQLNEMPGKKHRISRWMRYASAIIIIIASGLTFLFIKNNIGGDILVGDNNVETTSFEPGSRKAVLRLPDGKELDLSQHFSVNRSDGILIYNDTINGLVYEKKSEKLSPEYHVIEVPIGGEYDLKLSDGTVVYLNSGTRLSYPSFFDGDLRKVELTGEAYFEVSKERKPFVVHTNDLDVVVLGTSFNIRSYDQDSQVNTTLVSGKVRVMTPHDSGTYELFPNHNLNYNKNTGIIKNEKVDTDLYTSWIRGEFIFSNQSLGEILITLSRWYNFTVEYKNPSLKELKFTGSVDKRRPMSYFLNQISTVTNLKFMEDGKRIIFYD